MDNWLILLIVSLVFAGTGASAGWAFGLRAVRLLSMISIVTVLSLSAYWLYQGYLEHQMAGFLAALAGVTILGAVAAVPILCLVFAGRLVVRLRER